MPVRSQGARSLVARLLAAAATLALCLVSTAVAEEPAPGWSEDGLAYVHRDGTVKRIYRPEFRAAVDIASELAGIGGTPAAVDLIAPLVAVPPVDPKKPLPPRPSRILLTGTADEVDATLARIGRIDVPPRQAMVTMLVSEVSCAGQNGRGVRWDMAKSALDSPDEAFFRGFDSRFDPEAYLVGELSGARPFEGTTLRFGDPKFLGAAWEATFRMLMKQRSADMFAWPRLLCMENEPAELIALEEMILPIPINADPGQFTSTRAETVGIELAALAERIGNDHVVLSIDLWVREPEALEDAASRPSSVGLNVRQVTTTVTLRDGEPLLLGGLFRRRHAHLKKGLPVLNRFTLIDALTGSSDMEVIETELIFMIQADICRLVPPDPELRARAWPDLLRPGVTLPTVGPECGIPHADEKGPARKRAGPGCVVDVATDGSR